MVILMKFIDSFLAVWFTVYKDLIYQVKEKSTEYFGRCRSAKEPIVQEKMGGKKHFPTNLLHHGRPLTVLPIQS